ncbi:unnamed protein product [Allacma fusca]|uniref:DUF5077 domain-containing protein n=1 Tax=Allacma fusca TaxID=39272 RepID=A0A8J2L0F0_9HEXA|nr:unnamed protein product [Allacma fusca]
MSSSIAESKNVSTAIGIPVCGNAFVTAVNDPDCKLEVTGDGISNWDSSTSVWSVFFRVSAVDQIFIALRLRVPNSSAFLVSGSNGNGNGQYSVNIERPEGEEYQIVPVGIFPITSPGYVRLDFEGLERSGAIFADVSHVLLTYQNVNNRIVYNLAEDSYFGRRGPSVHLWFSTPNTEIEYFYNEVTVPEGFDQIGLYAMATGFTGGYFGMQVNSSTERRILFSVWSEYNSDDPSQVPKDYKVVLLRAGPDVQVREFGDEGCGAQSYFQYNWKSGRTYKFLVFGKPLNSNNTIYGAWFKESEETSWRLIAIFLKPKISSYLTGLYSFLENFEPDQGFLERRALFGNQLAIDSSGVWYPLVTAAFTGDATSKTGRWDFAGGIYNNNLKQVFYLRHCGFFSDFVPTGQIFQRENLSAINLNIGENEACLQNGKIRNTWRDRIVRFFRASLEYFKGTCN